MEVLFLFLDGARLLHGCGLDSASSVARGGAREEGRDDGGLHPLGLPLLQPESGVASVSTWPYRRAVSSRQVPNFFVKNSPFCYNLK